MQNLFMERYCIFPDQDSFIHMITVSQVALTQDMEFSLTISILNQAFFSVF